MTTSLPSVILSLRRIHTETRHHFNPNWQNPVIWSPDRLVDSSFLGMTKGEFVILSETKWRRRTQDRRNGKRERHTPARQSYLIVLKGFSEIE